MPQDLTFKALDDLQNAISDEMKDMKMWRNIAQSIAASTISTPDIAARYQDALNCHFYSHLPEMTLPKGSTSYSNDAFTHTLVAIEVAQPDLQRVVLAEVLDLVASMERYQETDNNRNFYTDMLNALGPRLHPENQTAMILWMFDNEITAMDENQFVYLAPNMPNPDHCTDDYDEDIVFEAANIILQKIENSPAGMTYDERLVSWVLSLADTETHPRYIRTFELPENDDSTALYLLWIAPKSNHASEIMCINDDAPLEPKSLSMLMTGFKYALKNPNLDPEIEIQIMNAIINLGVIFVQAANIHSDEPEFHAALIDAKKSLCDYALPSP